MTDIILSKKDLNIRLYNIIKRGGENLLVELNENSIYTISDYYEIKENNYIKFNGDFDDITINHVEITNFTKLKLSVSNNDNKELPKHIWIYIKNNTLINVSEFIDKNYIKEFTINKIYDSDIDNIETSKEIITASQDKTFTHHTFKSTDTLKIIKNK